MANRMEHPKRTSVRARVRVEVEFDVGSTWGTEVHAGQVYTQAMDDVEGMIANKLGPSVRIVGQPTVIAVLVDMDKK